MRKESEVVTNMNGANRKSADPMVEKPAHYQGRVECIDAIEAAVADLRGMAAVYTGHIIRYVWRWDRKNRLQDLHKARWYLDRLILAIENEDRK